MLELEFMAFLIGLERQAAEEDCKLLNERYEVCREAQTRFLHEHVAWWTPTFAKLLMLQDPNGYYEAVALFLAALIPAERVLLGVTTNETMATPSTVERPEECDGCAIFQ